LLQKWKKFKVAIDRRRTKQLIGP